jgi:ATP-dependent RNA helicase RhlE
MLKKLKTIEEMSFKDLNLSENLMKAIADAGYENPTSVQAKAIPIVLSGKDLLAGAQTGTGKTAAFTLPILHMLSEKDSADRAERRSAPKSKPRCLVLVPTRELAVQVEESVKTYGKYLPIKSTSVFGGMSIVPQIKALRRNVDILVATPGRLLDHAGQRTADLSGIEILVLDEADRMLDMGFIVDIKKIIALLPKQRQNLLFSATFSEKIKSLSEFVLRNPAFVQGEKQNSASELVDQSVHMVSQKMKSHLLSHLIKHHKWEQVLIFTRTKNGANRLADKLAADGISATAIHGNKSQPARIKALNQFKEGSVTALVATDVASRGIDIDRLPYVVNFELPNAAEDYVHRIGRTGRAGVSGKAVSLVDREEMRFLKEIERFIKREIPRVLFDSFVPPANINLPVKDAPREFNNFNHDTSERQFRGGTGSRTAQAHRKSSDRQDRQSRFGVSAAADGFKDKNKDNFKDKDSRNFAGSKKSFSSSNSSRFGNSKRQNFSKNSFSKPAKG